MIVIFGKRTNLTSSLVNALGESECQVVSTNDVLQGSVDWQQLNNSTFILNNFFSSKRLREASGFGFEDVVDYSIKSTSLILDSITDFNLTIDKIIYTSSASVYGDYVNNTLGSSIKIYSLLKQANEGLVANYCV